MTPSADAIVRVERVIRAPRERVWSLWTDPRRMRRWWGVTEGLELSVCEAAVTNPRASDRRLVALSI